jgi:type II secretory pathway pseudopilin PulG
LSPELRGRRAGFTLVEALVSLALILAFAAAVLPFLFQSRNIMSQADRRVAAHVLLRALIAAPSRTAVPTTREGETSGLRWRVVAQPVPLPMLPPRQGLDWVPVRISASVSWGPGRVIGAETIRVGRPP